MDYMDYEFKSPKLQQEYRQYLFTRNKQIVEFKNQGKSWLEISQIIGLSKGHIKTIGHKLGAYGKVPVPKVSNREQTTIL